MLFIKVICLYLFEFSRAELPMLKNRRSWLEHHVPEEDVTQPQRVLVRSNHQLDNLTVARMPENLLSMTTEDTSVDRRRGPKGTSEDPKGSTLKLNYNFSPASVRFLGNNDSSSSSSSEDEVSKTIAEGPLISSGASPEDQTLDANSTQSEEFINSNKRQDTHGLMISNLTDFPLRNQTLPTFVKDVSASANVSSRMFKVMKRPLFRRGHINSPRRRLSLRSHFPGDSEEYYSYGEPLQYDGEEEEEVNEGEGVQRPLGYLKLSYKLSNIEPYDPKLLKMSRPNLNKLFKRKWKQNEKILRNNLYGKDSPESLRIIKKEMNNNYMKKILSFGGLPEDNPKEYLKLNSDMVLYKTHVPGRYIMATKAHSDHSKLSAQKYIPKNKEIQIPSSIYPKFREKRVLENSNKYFRATQNENSTESKYSSEDHKPTIEYPDYGSGKRKSGSQPSRGKSSRFLPVLLDYTTEHLLNNEKHNSLSFNLSHNPNEWHSAEHNNNAELPKAGSSIENIQYMPYNFITQMLGLNTNFKSLPKSEVSKKLQEKKSLNLNTRRSSVWQRIFVNDKSRENVNDLIFDNTTRT